MKRYFLVLPLLGLLLPLSGIARTWDGSQDYHWNIAANWTPAGIPTASDDVTIPSGTPRQPTITQPAVCNNLTVNSGATLTKNDFMSLTVGGFCSVSGNLLVIGAGEVTVGDYMAVYGNLTMNGGAGNGPWLTVNGSFFWENGATANVNVNQAIITVIRNMQFASGASVQIAYGVVKFMGSYDQDIANYSSSTSLSTVMVDKTAGIFSFRSGGQPFSMGVFGVNPGSTAYNYYTGEITIGQLTDSNTSAAAGIRFNNGTVVMPANGLITVNSGSSYLNSVTVRASGGVARLATPLVMKGTLRVESGIFNPQNHTILIAGNWENTVGTAAFIEGMGMVTFNGTAHQYCNYTETFNLLKVNKSGGALRVDSATATVTCDQYNWTAGAIDVLEGTFTALDLADNGIFGNYYVNPGGTINLTNTDASINLCGNLTFTSGGTINVYGSNVSTWPGSANASLTMNGGTLNFADQGIYLASASTYTFTSNITGGTIQTPENFTCHSPAFAPSGGTVEMTGTVGAHLTMTAGTLYNLKTNKTVLLNSDINCNGGITIAGGYFRMEGYDVSCALDLLVYGILRMNSNEVFTVGDDVAWYSGSDDDATLGTIYCGGNWNVYSGSDASFPTAVITYLRASDASTIYIADSDFRFGILCVGTLSVPSTYTMNASGTQDLYVQGSLVITPGSELDLAARGMTVTGDLTLNGTLDIHSGAVTVMAVLNLNAGSQLNIDTGSLTGTSTIVPRQTYLYGNLWINSGSLVLANNILIILSGSTTTLVSGTIACDGIIATSAGTFQPAGGTVLLGDNYGASNSSIHVTNGNWLPNLTVDAGTDGFYLLADLVVKGNLTLTSGVLSVRDPDTSTDHVITVSGDWRNQGGTFQPHSGRVIFNGSGHQYVNYTETFNILEANKSGGALRVNGLTAVVTIAQYDWTAGAVDVPYGTLTINDLADNGMYGGFYCTSDGTLNITQDAAQTVNLYGILQVTGGEVNISGGSGTDANWARYSACTVNVSGGTINYLDKGIQIRNTYAFTYAISGGTITTTGNIYCNRTDFVPAGGTFEMRGATNTSLDFQSAPGSSLCYLTINKNTLSARVTQSATTQTLTGDLVIDNGTYYMINRTLNCEGYLTVYSDAKLQCEGFSTVKISTGKWIDINAGGYLDAIGASNDSRVTFTHSNDGYFSVMVREGGTLSANYVVFEYLATEGVEVFMGGSIGGLHNCTFQHGIAGGRMLSIKNNQDIVITHANFPTNAGGGAKNVSKTWIDAGSVTLSDYSGAFSGPAFEQDIYGHVFWTGSNTDLYVSAYTLDRPDEYVCAPLSFTVTVQNGGSNDIAIPFRVDLFKNQPSAPPAGALGDHFLEITHLDAGQSKSVTFTNLSTDMVSTWNSWLRLDTTGFVTETNEANNVSGPYQTAWQALPEIANLNLILLNPAVIRLSWEYPIPVTRFNVYRGTDPAFTATPDNLWAWPTSPVVNTGAFSPMYFYRVRASRDLPTTN